MTLPKGSKHSAKQGLTGHFPGSLFLYLVYFFWPPTLSLLSGRSPHLPFFFQCLVFRVTFNSFYPASRSSVRSLWTLSRGSRQSPLWRHPQHIFFSFSALRGLNCLLSVSDNSSHISWRNAKQRSECGLSGDFNCSFCEHAFNRAGVHAGSKCRTKKPGFITIPHHPATTAAIQMRE